MMNAENQEKAKPYRKHCLKVSLIYTFADRDYNEY